MTRLLNDNSVTCHFCHMTLLLHNRSVDLLCDNFFTWPVCHLTILIFVDFFAFAVLSGDNCFTQRFCQITILLQDRWFQWQLCYITGQLHEFRLNESLVTCHLGNIQASLMCFRNTYNRYLIS